MIDTRKRDWRAILVDYMAEKGPLSFEYGEHDSWTFVMGAAGAIRGEDLVGKVKGYSGWEEGLELLKEETGRRGLLDFVARKFRKAPNIWEAMGGDIAAIETEDGINLGLVQGGMIYVLTKEAGINLTPLDNATGVYRV